MRKNIVKIGVFLLVFIACISAVYNILKYKSSYGAEQVDLFYDLPEDSVDVLIVGNSHVYMDIDTGVLWDDYGIAVFDLSTSGQPMWNSYYFIVEALKTQTPQLIVVETMSVKEDMEYGGDGSIGSALFGMKYSTNFFKAVEASADEEKRWEYIIKYPYAHLRYTDLGKKDFDPESTDTFMGYLPLFVTTEFEELPEIQESTTITDEVKLPEKNMEYVMKIISLAKENDIPILFVEAPYMGWAQEESMKLSEAFAAAMEEADTPYVNFNKKVNEIGLDAATDFAEASHLNWKGAEKYARYLGQYIMQNFEIVHTDQESDLEWETNAKMLSRKKFNYVLPQEDVEQYIELILALDEGYDVIVTVNGQPDTEWLQSVWPYYAGGNAMWIKTDESFEKLDVLEYNELLEADNLHIQYEEEKKRYHFWYNSEEYTKTTVGINVYVYDEQYNTLVDAVGFLEDKVYR